MNLKNDKNLQKIARIARAEEKGYAYDNEGYQMAEIRVKCIDSKEASEKGIDPSVRHKFLGDSNTIESFFFNKEDYKKIPRFIKDSIKPITSLKNVAFIAPIEVGKMWVEQSRHITTKKKYNIQF